MGRHKCDAERLPVSASEEFISPRLCGKLDFARGVQLEDCPYDEARNVADWQEGWRFGRDLASLRPLA